MARAIEFCRSDGTIKWGELINKLRKRQKMDYYLLVNNQQIGPYPPPQIQGMWNSGAIASDSLYWNAEAEEWRPINELIETLNPLPPVVEAPIPPVVVTPPASLSARAQMHEEEEYEYEENDGGDGCSGWLAWIGILILVNVLSQIFDWGWFFY